MNWIQGIQRAIDYVEANITEDINYEEVAKQAYSSVFHPYYEFFQPFTAPAVRPLIMYFWKNTNNSTMGMEPAMEKAISAP